MYDFRNFSMLQVWDKNTKKVGIKSKPQSSDQGLKEFIFIIGYLIRTLHDNNSSSV